MKNYCYVDGQNLYLGTSSADYPWSADLYRFRIYLTEKYGVKKAFYHLGYFQETNSANKLYSEIKAAGFILMFRQHSSSMSGKKKGNVDSDIVFSIMKHLYIGENTGKVILVSGDGDYKMLVDFLIQQKRFEKILFPNKRFRSSLYKQIGSTYFASLDDKDTKKKIAKMKRAP